MLCPRCGQEAQDAPSCPRCGVVFAKLGPRPARAASPRPPQRPQAPPPSEARSWGLARNLGLVLLAVGFVALGIRGLQVGPGQPETSPATRRAPAATRPSPPVAIAAASPPAPLLVSPGRGGPPALTSPPPPSSADMAPADLARAEALSAAVRDRQAMGASDVTAVLDLLNRYPAAPGLVDLAEAVLVRAAQAERALRRHAQAEELLRRALRVKAGSRPARSLLLEVLLEASNWAAAEEVAREILAETPGDAAALLALGQALMRQDRNREAVEALRASLSVKDSAAAREMLGHLEKGLRDEKGMSEKQLAHFTVRYDGGAHEDVGREILRALDRHHATLTTVFDHRPTASIPVILFSQEDYYDAAGAPRWSGGVFNHFDGRIRIPIRGIGVSLTPDIDDVLVHEVTHAFVADLTRGTCPRDVHEGLAQYMEGKRIATVLGGAELRALADGRMRGVSGFYLGALAFVEFLMGQRGQGGVNDLLRAMGDVGDVNAAFRQVYGQDHAATNRAFSERFRRQHGS